MENSSYYQKHIRFLNSLPYSKSSYVNDASTLSEENIANNVNNTPDDLSTFDFANNMTQKKIISRDGYRAQRRQAKERQLLGKETMIRTASDKSSLGNKDDHIQESADLSTPIKEKNFNLTTPSGFEGLL